MVLLLDYLVNLGLRELETGAELLKHLDLFNKGVLILLQSRLICKSFTHSLSHF